MGICILLALKNKRLILPGVPLPTIMELMANGNSAKVNSVIYDYSISQEFNSTARVIRLR